MKTKNILRFFAHNVFMQKYKEVIGFEKVKKQSLLILLGCITGILSGLLGGGGGMIVVPALQYIENMSEKQAHATAIAVILPVTIVGAVVYLLRGVQLASEYPVLQAGVIVGGVIGATLLNKLSNRVLSLLFYGLMIFAGIKMIIA